MLCIYVSWKETKDRVLLRLLLVYACMYLVGAPPERHEAEGEQRGEKEEEDLYGLFVCIFICG